VSRPALGWRDRRSPCLSVGGKGHKTVIIHCREAPACLPRLNGMARELHKFSAEAILNAI
jgi:hypothetical protein